MGEGGEWLYGYAAERPSDFSSLILVDTLPREMELNVKADAMKWTVEQKQTKKEERNSMLAWIIGLINAAAVPIGAMIPWIYLKNEYEYCWSILKSLTLIF